MRNDAKAYALKLLGYRSRSRKEIRDRLQRKGFDSVQIDETIEYLEEKDLVNDKALASDLLEYSIEKKSLGRRGIRMFLDKRGIHHDLIDSVMSSHTLEREEKSACDFARRKMRNLKNYPGDVVQRKLWGMLQRRGFPTEIVRKAVESARKGNSPSASSSEPS